jgi:hypothetical protein
VSRRVEPTTQQRIAVQSYFPWADSHRRPHRYRPPIGIRVKGRPGSAACKGDGVDDWITANSNGKTAVSGLATAFRLALLAPASIMLAGGLVVGGSGKGYTRPAMGRYGHFSAVEGLPSGSALLVVKRGPNAGARFLLDRPITSAGRDSGSDIVLDDVTVSGRHAEFRWENDELHVVDVGSLYGTYVNGSWWSRRRWPTGTKSILAYSAWLY